MRIHEYWEMINWFANPVYTFDPDPDQPNRIRNTMISTQVCQLLFAFDIRASIDYVHYKYEYRYGSEQIAKSEVIFWEQRKKKEKRYTRHWQIGRKLARIFLLRSIIKKGNRIILSIKATLHLPSLGLPFFYPISNCLI